MKIFALLFTLVLIFTAVFTVAAEDFPREESLTTNGQQWGAPANFNPYALSNIAGQLPIPDESPFMNHCICTIC